MHSFGEVIEYAIRHEEEEAAFYEGLAERAESTDQKKAMLEHARQEREHKRHLENILSRHRLPDGSRTYPDPDLHLSDYMVAEDSGTGTLDYEASLLLAAKREKAAQRLYQQMADQAEDPGLKEVFAFLAVEEGRHASALEQEFDDTLIEG